jgi:peptide chain release factor 3
MYKACWIECDDKTVYNDFIKRKWQNMAIDKHGRDVFMAETQYALNMAIEKFPEINFKFSSEF